MPNALGYLAAPERGRVAAASRGSARRRLRLAFPRPANRRSAPTASPPAGQTQTEAGPAVRTGRRDRRSRPGRTQPGPAGPAAWEADFQRGLPERTSPERSQAESPVAAAPGPAAALLGAAGSVRRGRDGAGQSRAEGGDNPAVAVTWSR